MTGKKGGPRKTSDDEPHRDSTTADLEVQQAEPPPISEERLAAMRKRLEAARAAAYAKDPQYRERLWYSYSRSLFNFMLKEYCRSLPPVVPPTGGPEQELSEKGEVS
jgi:hypothetical protein